MRNGIRVAKYAVLFSVVFVLAGCGVPKSEHEALVQKYAGAQEEIKNSSVRVKAMQRETAALRERTKGLERQVDELVAENRVLKESSEALEKVKEAE